MSQYQKLLTSLAIYQAASMKTDPESGYDIVTIPISTLVKMKGVFSLDRSTDTGAGSQVTAISFGYTVLSGTLTSLTFELQRVSFTNGTSSTATVGLLAPSPTPGLTAGDWRPVANVSVPAYDNQSAGTSVQYVCTVNVVGSLFGTCIVQINGIELLYNFGIPSGGTFANAVLTGTTTITGTQTTTGTATFNGPVVTNSTLAANGANTFAGAINSTNTTNATSVGTGAIHTLGGIGVSQDVFAGGNGTFTNIRLAGSGTASTYTTVTSTQTGNITINMPTTSDTLVGLATTDVLTNKTLTSNTDNVTARALWYGSGAGSISGYAATAPTAGQVPTAVDASTFNWQTPTTGVNDVALQGNTTQTATAGGTLAIAIGRNASAAANNSIALGQGAVTSVSSTFIVQPGSQTTLANSTNGLFSARAFTPISGNPSPTVTQFINARATGGNATLLTQDGTGIDNASISTVCSVSQFPSQSITCYYTTDASSTLSWGTAATGVTLEGAASIPPSSAATVVWTRTGVGQWLIVTIVGA